MNFFLAFIFIFYSPYVCLKGDYVENRFNNVSLKTKAAVGKRTERGQFSGQLVSFAAGKASAKLETGC